MSTITKRIRDAKSIHFTTMESKIIKTNVFVISPLGFESPALLVGIKTDKRCLGNQRAEIVDTFGRKRNTPIRNLKFV